MAHIFDDIAVVQINAGDEDSADITLEYNTKRITISVFAHPSSTGGGCGWPNSPCEN